MSAMRSSAFSDKIVALSLENVVCYIKSKSREISNIGHWVIENNFGASWTGPALSARDTIKAIHILDSRTFLDDARPARILYFGVY